MMTLPKQLLMEEATGPDEVRVSDTNHNHAIKVAMVNTVLSDQRSTLRLDLCHLLFCTSAAR
jgi:hypothetical protein